MENEVKGFLKNQNKTVLTWAISVLLFSLSAAVLMYVFNKQKESNSYAPSKYYVSEGTARMKISPDFAELTLSIVSTSSVSIEEAKSFTENKINEIKKDLEGKQGVEISKLADYTVYPDYTDANTGLPTVGGDFYEGDDYYTTERIKDYSYTGTYVFKIENISEVDRVESILKSKVKDNPLSYVSYPVYKLKNAEAKFRELSQESLKVARLNAKNIEKSAGLDLGKPFSVYVGEYYMDGSTGQVTPQVIARDFFAYMDKGERDYELKTSITYEVK